MNRLFLMAMVAVMVCCTSCVGFNFKDIDKLEPSGNIVKNEYKMDAFEKVDVDISAKVKFVQSISGDYRVLLRCSDNYVDLFDFKVANNELKLEFTKNLHQTIDSEDVAIIICSPILLSLDNEGVGVFVIDSLDTPSLNIDGEGVGNITIHGLKTEMLKVKSEGVGNIEVKGEARSASFECNGVGNVNAGELKAAEVNVMLNGVGSVTCFASESLKGDVNGIGSLKYGGHPEQKQLNRNGLGTITETDL